MQIDEAVGRVAAKLDEWLAESRVTFVSEDGRKQTGALLGGFALVRELDRLKGDGLKAIRGLLNPAHMSMPAEYVKSLVRGFEFAAKLVL
jgi:hypothetical protein